MTQYTTVHKSSEITGKSKLLICYFRTQEHVLVSSMSLGQNLDINQLIKGKVYFGIKLEIIQNDCIIREINEHIKIKHI